MALEDKDIFNAICSRSGDQSIESIMEQYEKAKLLNMQIEKRLDSLLTQAAPCESEIAETREQIEVTETAPKKKFDRRKFAVKPNVAITEDSITCCICGEARQSLTSTHLAKHDLTAEEYKQLCGYPANQKLMSGKRLAKSKEIIRRAQKARLEKIAERSDDWQA